MNIYSLIQSLDYAEGSTACVISSHYNLSDASLALREYVHSGNTNDIIDIDDDAIDSFFVSADYWYYESDGVTLEYYICESTLS